MEAQARVFTFNKKDIKSIAEDYKAKNSLNNKEFAELIKVSRTAVSQYFSGTYSNPRSVEAAIMEYFKSTGEFESEEMALSPAPIIRPNVYYTADTMGVMAVCQSCQDYSGLGVIVGRSGFGKTFTLNQFARGANVYYIECEDTTSAKDLVEAIEDAIGLPSGYGTISKRLKSIREFFNVNTGSLLIIDEADKLLNKYTQKKMEILRTIFDKSTVGLIIAGEPALESLIRTYLPRFANRVDFKFSLHGLSIDEVHKYLEGCNFTPDAVEEMINRGTNSKSGCFRLLDRTLKNVLRIAGADTEVTPNMIKQASKMMML